MPIFLETRDRTGEGEGEVAFSAPSAGIAEIEQT